jgi:type IV pilus assembly protein PilC
MAAKAKKAEKVEFTYQGTNRAGAKVKGEIFALSDTLAKSELRKQGVNPLKVKKKPQPLFGSAKPEPADIAIFARQIATMMQAGVPLVQSFEIIGQGHEKQTMQKLILAIKSEVEGGVLAAALQKPYALASKGSAAKASVAVAGNNSNSYKKTTGTITNVK